LEGGGPDDEGPPDYDQLIRLIEAAERGEEPPPGTDERFLPGLAAIRDEAKHGDPVARRVYEGLGVPAPEHELFPDGRPPRHDGAGGCGMI
jgi:hypothetical protein